MDVARILEGLEALRLDELRQVEARARELIERIAEWQKPAPTAEELARAPEGCYRLEYVRCGKERLLRPFGDPGLWYTCSTMICRSNEGICWSLACHSNW